VKKRARGKNKIKMVHDIRRLMKEGALFFYQFKMFHKTPGFDKYLKTILKEEENERNGKKIKCCTCHTLITYSKDRIKISGQHQHTFKNPQGVVYTIDCYQSAVGCQVYGTPTHDFTWFKGFVWSFAMCSKCYQHLGWKYESGGSGFFGLITDKIYVSDD
jgi:hypothetical protein